MSQIFNQYSALWLTAALLALVVAVTLFRHKPGARDFLTLGVVAAGLAVAWMVLHPVQTPLMEDAQKVQSMIGQGKPVLLEFQSPY